MFTDNKKKLLSITNRTNKNKNKLIPANQNSKHLEMIFRKWRDVKQAFSESIGKEQKDKLLWCVQKGMCKGYDQDTICHRETGSKVRRD